MKVPGTTRSFSVDAFGEEWVSDYNGSAAGIFGLRLEKKVGLDQMIPKMAAEGRISSAVFMINMN